MKRFFLLLVGMALLLSSDILYALAQTQQGSQILANDKVFSGTGVALTPRNFPSPTSQDISQMFKIGKTLGNYAVNIGHWSDPNLVSTAKFMMKNSMNYGITPIIGLSPLTLAGLRDQLDVPEEVRNNAGSNLSFANPAVQTAFIQTALELAKLKPPYLCLATEINFMAFKNIEEYKHIVDVYKMLYPQIKKISPSTKVFVSFQWDLFAILDIMDPQGISEHSKLIDLFRPELDLVAFTSYPNILFSDSSQIPLNYYSGIYQHLNKSDEVMFMEIGWPAVDKNGEIKQQNFIQLMPQLMKDVKPGVIAWSFLHDVQGTVLSSDVAGTGLLTNSGVAKTGLNAFKGLQLK